MLLLHALTRAMRARRRSLELGLVALAAAACGVALPALASPQQPSTNEPPPQACSLYAAAGLRPSANFDASLIIERDGRALVLHWRYSSVGNFKQPEAATKQSFPVRYWATSVEAAAPTVMLVAGRERDGRTCIERWKVAPPRLIVDPNTAVVRLEPQSLIEVEPLYDAATAGKNMAVNMLRVRGKPHHVLVRFFDSGAVYELDWQTAPHALQPVLTAAQFPALSNVYDECSAGDHETLGYVYKFSQRDAYFSVPTLVLVDSDRNGAVDTQLALDGAAYRAHRLNLRSAYLELNGELP